MSASTSLSWWFSSITKTTVIGCDGVAVGVVGCVGGTGPGADEVFVCDGPHPNDRAASRRMGSNFLNNWNLL
jgi:hypothetical protein